MSEPPILSYASPAHSDDRPPSPSRWLWLSATILFFGCGSLLALVAALYRETQSPIALLFAVAPLGLAWAEWALIWRGSLVAAAIIDMFTTAAALVASTIVVGIVATQVGDVVHHASLAEVAELGGAVAVAAVVIFVFLTHIRFTERVAQWRDRRRNGISRLGKDDA